MARRHALWVALWLVAATSAGAQDVDVDALLGRLDGPWPAARAAFWTLVDRAPLTAEALAERAAAPTLGAQRRWLLTRAARYVRRGYTRRLVARAGEPLRGYETLGWRQRRARLSQMARLAGVPALRALRRVLARETAPPVRRRIDWLIGNLSLDERRPELNAALRERAHGKAIAILERLVAAHPAHPELHVELGCLRALAGRPLPALEALGRAVELGYGDLTNLEEEPDLVSLREDARFKALLEKIR